MALRTAKRLFADILLASGLLRLAAWTRIRLLRRPTVHILCYHRIREGSFLLGPQCVAPEEFERQVDHFTRSNDAIGLPDVPGRLSGPAPSRDAVVFTFDDGYLDNYLTALPILEKHGAKGTFFVASDPLLHGRPYWYDRVGQILESLDLSRNPAPCPDSTANDLLAAFARSGPAERPAAGIAFLRHLMTLPEAARMAALDFLETVESTDPRAPTPDFETFSLDDALDIVRRGHEIGAHTMTHPVLAALDEARCKEEILGSRDAFMEAGIPVRSFAYPFGREIDIGDTARRILSDAGFQVAVTTSERAVSPGDDPLHLPRKIVAPQSLGQIALKLERNAWLR